MVNEVALDNRDELFRFLQNEAAELVACIRSNRVLSSNTRLTGLAISSQFAHQERQRSLPVKHGAAYPDYRCLWVFRSSLGGHGLPARELSVCRGEYVVSDRFTEPCAYSRM